MRKTIDIDVFDLEETDTIYGYKVRELLVFAEAAREAHVTNDELRSFINDLGQAYKIMRKEFEEQQKFNVDEILEKVRNETVH